MGGAESDAERFRAWNPDVFVRHCGVEEGRPDIADPHSEWTPSRIEGFGESAHREFRRRVGGQFGLAVDGGCRCHVDHLGTGRPCGIGECTVAAGDHSANVHGEHRLVSGEGNGFEAARCECPGVVEQHAQPLAASPPELGKRDFPVRLAEFDSPTQPLIGELAQHFGNEASATRAPAGMFSASRARP